MDNIRCCYIADNGLECLNSAQYRIISGTSPDDYTETCSDHLELMLDDSPRFEIIRIEE